MSSPTWPTTSSSRRSGPASRRSVPSALESRIQAELDLGHHLAVVAETGTLIADHPLRERLHAQRILALYRAGRQSDALAAYRELRAVLDTELGIEPSPPLQELNNRVLTSGPGPGLAATRVDLGHDRPPTVARPSPSPCLPSRAPRTGSPRLRLAAVGGSRRRARGRRGAARGRGTDRGGRGAGQRGQRARRVREGAGLGPGRHRTRSRWRPAGMRSGSSTPSDDTVSEDQPVDARGPADDRRRS